MKTIELGFVLLLFAGIALGQPIKKGALIGVHVEDIKLSSGVTMDQYMNFVINKYVPEYEKAFGSKVHIVKGIRGENADKYAMFIIYDSPQTRDKYFKADGTLTETAGKSASAKMESLNKELEKLGTSESKYTDWVVQ